MSGFSRPSWFAALLAGAALFGAETAGATMLDPNFEESTFIDNVVNVTGMAWAPDDSQRLFLTIKDGEALVIEDGVRLATPFAIFDPIFINGEAGLLSIAFDPDYVRNRYVYFFVTVPPAKQQIIRYRDDHNVGVDKTIIVDDLPTRGLNHNGGALAFGPDGKLYWAIGDNGNGTGAGDDLGLLAAKVGRVNRDGSVPADNPFADGDGPNDDRIWARGFRNPFSMTFQPATDELWLNVVGTLYEQSFVVHRGDHGGWNTYENDQPPPYITPQIAFFTNHSQTFQIPAAGAARAGGIATYTTVEPITFRKAMQLTVSGLPDASFNGTFNVASVLGPNTFTVVQAGPDATTGGGSILTLDIGGCITGGTFFDSTAGTPEYRGNYFISDYNSGRATRAIVNGTSVEWLGIWSTDFYGQTDFSVGPDGDLYFANFYYGLVTRAHFLATAQGIVASGTNLRLVEGGHGAFHVRLAQAPSADTTLRVARVSGDPDVLVTGGASLVFTPDDWSVPQAVTLQALADADEDDDLSVLSLTATGVPSESVNVRVTDPWDTPADPPPGGTTGDSGAGGEAGASVGTTGGTNATGGRTGGSSATGGRGGTVSRGGTGGRSGTAGGNDGNGGANDGGEAGATTGDAGANGAGGTSGAGGHGGTAETPAGTPTDSGCGCRTARPAHSPWASLSMLFLLWVWARRRERD